MNDFQDKDLIIKKRLGRQIDASHTVYNIFKNQTNFFGYDSIEVMFANENDGFDTIEVMFANANVGYDSIEVMFAKALSRFLVRS